MLSMEVVQRPLLQSLSRIHVIRVRNIDSGSCTDLEPRQGGLGEPKRDQQGPWRASRGQGCNSETSLVAWLLKARLAEP